MLDELDRGLIHALRVDGRAPYSRIAAVLGSAPQTIARRYEKLRHEASLRVVGLANPRIAGETQWMVRLTTSPHSAQTVAHALVRRPDTSWVRLTSSGTEVIAMVATAVGDAPHSLLRRDIPRTANIKSVSAECMLHTYLGGPIGEPKITNSLTEDQQRQLVPPDRSSLEAKPQRRILTNADRELLNVLQRDGRASYAELAAATGWSAATAARHLGELQASEAIFFDIEVDDAALGAKMQVMLWLSVAPAYLDKVAATLADHHELEYVAATTGPTNLVAVALCKDPAGLHHYMTHRLSGLSAIQSLATAPVLQTLKAAGRAIPAAPAKLRSASTVRRPPHPATGA